jgi:DNA excision repair protein ERCC-6
MVRIPTEANSVNPAWQVAAFLAGLHRSQLFRPSLVVCPATMLRQWKRELRLWCPAFSVGILHDSTVSAKKAAAHGGKARAQARMVEELLEHPAGVLITTYAAYTG